jgi:hypothetical protein
VQDVMLGAVERRFGNNSCRHPQLSG